MFTNRDNDTNIMINYQDEQLAKQLGNVMLETTIDCGNTKRLARELAINCASTNNIICAGEDACTKLNETFIKMINETLSKDLEYEIKLTDFNEEETLKIITEGCINIKRGAKAFPTVIGDSNYGAITLTTKICY